jgi:recombination protein RecR
MYSFPKSLQKLVRELSRLPSVGEKTASRLAYHLVANDPELAGTLSEALLNAVQGTCFCKQCFSLTEGDLCHICQDSKRDGRIVCVVEKPMDIVAIERTREFNGLYHVLHGVWAPLRGLGPESMKLRELVERLQSGTVTELIMATSSTVEGDATALYVARVVSEYKVTVSRLAQGVPKGGELEYLDDVTLSRAFQGRSLLS